MVEHIGEPSINELRIALDQYEEALKRWREVAILYNQTRGMRTSPVDPDDQRHLYRFTTVGQILPILERWKSTIMLR